MSEHEIDVSEALNRVGSAAVWWWSVFFAIVAAIWFACRTVYGLCVGEDVAWQVAGFGLAVAAFICWLDIWARLQSKCVDVLHELVHAASIKRVEQVRREHRMCRADLTSVTDLLVPVLGKMSEFDLSTSASSANLRRILMEQGWEDTPGSVVERLRLLSEEQGTDHG